MKRHKTNPRRLELLSTAVQAISAVADDKSVSCETSIKDLEALASDIECAIDGLRDDIKHRERP